MAGPLVSVIIPVYNRPRLVQEAAESVLAQTFGDLELILVDDGSTDETPTVLAELAAQAPHRAADTRVPAAGEPAGRITVHRIAHDGHPGAVRNRGAELAQGRYLAFLDADDLWRPQKLARQLALHEDSTPGVSDPGSRTPRLSHTREQWIRNGREVSQKGIDHARAGWIFEDALKKCTIGPSTVMMERALFEKHGGFREDLEIAEDYELWLRITARHAVAYLDEPLTVKRAGHGDQLSEKYGQIERFRIEALRDLVQSGYFEDCDAERGPGGGRGRADAAAGDHVTDDPAGGPGLGGAAEGAEHPGAGATSTPPPIAPLALAELARKCRIYAAGCEKRGRVEEAEAYRAEATHYEVRYQGACW
jgi:glycosyltransferase involved in cell wall biosynthesis